jgi:predicted DNA-binding WGR domain protein
MVVGEQSDLSFAMHSVLKSNIERKETNGQRYLRHFPANQVNDDDIELTDEKKENHYKPF